MSSLASNVKTGSNVSRIPKIIHQLWIGDKPPPTKMMDTWRDMNPEFEYIRWTEDLIREKKLKFECKKRIQEMDEINGKADIMRWEILWRYGGVFIDADSFCIEPIDDTLMNTQAFAGWEHEELRPGLVATGTMGFPPDHALPRAAIDWMLINSVSFEKTKLKAWQSVGPGLLTKLYNTKVCNDMTVFPSYYFLPVHCTGQVYKGHGKVYAYQEWGSTKQNYEKMHMVEIPDFILNAKVSLSVLIPNYNTKAAYIKECLESIKHQEGKFNIELVWIDDGSTPLNKLIAKKMLDRLINETRNITLSYYENDGNKGLGYTLNRGVTLCSNEAIMRMDADDIMIKDRLAKQITLLLQDPGIMLSGGQIEMFKSNGITSLTSHSSITWADYKKKPYCWIVNHPAVCFRKSAILAVGNYNPDIAIMYEDFDLWLRMLRRFGTIHNSTDVVLRYRLHDEQITGDRNKSEKWDRLRKDLIKRMISNDTPDEDACVIDGTIVKIDEPTKVEELETKVEELDVSSNNA
jgi:mannosyltransferase OCH1-like enzyme